MGAPEVEDAAGGGEGVVLKIQAWGFKAAAQTLELTLTWSTSHPW
jgi:hypothetical protein